MATKIEALSRGGHVYTITPYRGDKIPGARWKYIGFKDGQRWGAFVSKKEWQQAVELESDFVACPALTDQYVKALHAEMLSTWEGARLLKELQAALRASSSASPSMPSPAPELAAPPRSPA